MMSQETKQPLTKYDILRATENYLSMCSDKTNSLALGGMETHLTERESETFYFMITTTSL